MERDFLGAIGRIKRETEAKEAAEAAAAGNAESDYLGATQWQYQAMAAATPPFMSFRPAMEDSFSGFRQQPAAVVPAVARMPHHQGQFGFDGHVIPHQYAAVPHAHGHGIDSYDVAAARHLQGGSVPLPFHQSMQFTPDNPMQFNPMQFNPGNPMQFNPGNPMQFNPGNPMQFSPGNPMFGVQSLPSAAAGVPSNNQYFMMNSPVPGSTVGAYGPRDLQNPESTRMTIFYNGAVNVFDDVPIERAQKLMVLASRASIPIQPGAVQKSDLPVTFADTRFAAPEVSPAKKIIIQKPETIVRHVSAISSPVPLLSQPLALSKSTSSSNNESAGPTSSSVAVPSVVPRVSQASSAQQLQQAISAASAAAVTPRAVPQARRASLTRFLEKRKDRVVSVAPYQSSKSPLDSSDTLGSTTTLSKSSGTDIAPSINNDLEPMSLGLSRNISFNSKKLPSTDLQM